MRSQPGPPLVWKRLRVHHRGVDSIQARTLVSLILCLIHRSRGRGGRRGGSVLTPLSEGDACHFAARNRRYSSFGDSQEDIVVTVRVEQLLGKVGEHRGEARGWSVGLPALARVISSGTCDLPFRPRLFPVLSRHRPSGSVLDRLLSSSSGHAERRGPGG